MAISKETAAEMAGSKVRAIQLPDDEAVLVGEPLEWDHGWVFFYDSRTYVETDDFSHALAGNAPIVVLRSGEIRETGTAHPIEYYLQQLREELGSKSSHGRKGR